MGDVIYLEEWKRARLGGRTVPPINRRARRGRGREDNPAKYGVLTQQLLRSLLEAEE